MPKSVSVMRAGIAALLVVALGLAALGGIWWTRDDTLERGRAAYDRKDWQTAWNRARERLRTDPNDPEAWQLVARSARRLGRIESAQSIYDQRLGPKHMGGEDYYLLGIGLLAQSRPAPAQAAFEEGLNRDPPHPELIQELARLYAGIDDLAKATELASRLHDIPGWEARGDVLVGMLNAENSDPLGAWEHLSRALKRDPKVDGALASPTSVRKLLARSSLKLGQGESAIPVLNQILAAGPDPEASWLASRALLQSHDFQAAATALEQSHGYHDDAVLNREPAPYVGAAKCAECHPDNYRTQQKSRHGRTFYPTNDLDRVKVPNHPIADPHDKNIVHSITREGHQIQVETKVKDASFPALIDYALGSGDQGITLVGHDPSGSFNEIRLSHYTDINGWDVTTGHPANPPEPELYLGLPISADGVRHCLQCHTTNARAAIDRVGPTVQDHGIGCERCHGPAGNHLEAIAAKFPDPAISRPRLLTAIRQVQLCGECHSPRGATVNDPSRPVLVRFQATTLPKSRCFTESAGRLSCTTCHNPHRNASTSEAFYNGKCLSCHTSGVQTDDKPNVPCPVNAVNDCVKCHMPKVDGVAPHARFADHHIRVHEAKPKP